MTQLAADRDAIAFRRSAAPEGRDGGDAPHLILVCERFRLVETFAIDDTEN